MQTKILVDQPVKAEAENLLNLVSLLFHLLPKNLLSFITGVIVRIEWPAPFNRLLCASFARAFGLDLSEAEHPLSSYRSIEDLFTRRLKPGVRPIKGMLCSPSDGTLSISQPAQSEQAVQAKGLTYSLRELVFGEGAGKTSDLTWYQTIYLAPHNYHRVHAPVSGRLVGLRYFPGQLWPVNLTFVRRIPRLFVKNERLVFEIATQDDARVHVVMVGALNVGRMVTPHFPGFVTNGLARQTGPARPHIHEYRQPIDVKIGDELGTFMMGSTVVLAYESKFAAKQHFRETLVATPVQMGEPLSEHGQ